jgi:hypothetical protein
LIEGHLRAVCARAGLHLRSYGGEFDWIGNRRYLTATVRLNASNNQARIVSLWSAISAEKFPTWQPPRKLLDTIAQFVEMHRSKNRSKPVRTSRPRVFRSAIRGSPAVL